MTGELVRPKGSGALDKRLRYMKGILKIYFNEKDFSTIILVYLIYQFYFALLIRYAETMYMKRMKNTEFFLID